MIVTNGAIGVRAKDGDDLICVTGTSDNSNGPTIEDGPGNDLVDASHFVGLRVETRLGSGSDQYLGRVGKDVVYADGVPGDRDDIRTGDGRDYVAAVGDGEWYVRIALGPLHDEVNIGVNVTFDLDGGQGRDLVIARGCDCGGTVVDLGAGTWIDARQESAIRAFERANIVAEKLVLYGTEATDFLRFGCGARVYGRGSGDSLNKDSTDPSCEPSRQYGGPGNDNLHGEAGRDLLYGGRGSDYADGGQGTDLCRAEETHSCEESAAISDRSEPR